MKIPEDLRTWYSVACDKVHFATDYDAIRKLIERIATLTEQLEQANSHLNWLPSDQSFICSGCAAVYPNPHATDCPEVQQ